MIRKMIQKRREKQHEKFLQKIQAIITPIMSPLINSVFSGSYRISSLKKQNDKLKNENNEIYIQINLLALENIILKNKLNRVLILLPNSMRLLK